MADVIKAQYGLHRKSKAIFAQTNLGIRQAAGGRSPRKRARQTTEEGSSAKGISHSMGSSSPIRATGGDAGDDGDDDDDKPLGQLAKHQHDTEPPKSKKGKATAVESEPSKEPERAKENVGQVPPSVTPVEPEPLSVDPPVSRPSDTPVERYPADRWAERSSWFIGKRGPGIPKPKKSEDPKVASAEEYYTKLLHDLAVGPVNIPVRYLERPPKMWKSRAFDVAHKDMIKSQFKVQEVSHFSLLHDYHVQSFFLNSVPVADARCKGPDRRQQERDTGDG